MYVFQGDGSSSIYQSVVDISSDEIRDLPSDSFTKIASVEGEDYRVNDDMPPIPLTRSASYKIKRDLSAVVSLLADHSSNPNALIFLLRVPARGDKKEIEIEFEFDLLVDDEHAIAEEMVSVVPIV
jgi:hypothetical protein